MRDEIFAFVLLHYNEPHVTEMSVESILNNTENDTVEIVIVDNCSPDGSGKLLAAEYKENSHIKVLCAQSNLGFAKGNNLGYKYARDVLKADYICVMNNDVLLLQPDFLQRVKAEYKSSGCGIIGPHITLLNGYTNYMYLKIHSRTYFEKELEKSKRMYRYYMSKLFPIRNIINQVLDQTLLKYKKRKMQEDSLDDRIDMAVASKQRHRNIVLHGCCLILTPVYIRKFEDAFDDRTFMFREEELLYLRCRRNQVETVYEPSIDILHLEDMSTNATFKKNNKREAFKWKCQIDSLQILLEEIK